MAKIVSLPEAVATVRDGDTVALGGFTIARRPMAAVAEMIRQKKKDLFLVMAQGIAEDIMIGAGLSKMVLTPYLANEVYGLGFCFRRAFEKKSILVDDCGQAFHISSFLAAEYGLPFFPSIAAKGSDIYNPAYDGFKELRGKDLRLPAKKYAVIEDPFWGEGKIVLIPALRIDVAIIHVQQVGEKGTVRIYGPQGTDTSLLHGCKRVIVTCEEIVPEEELRGVPELNAASGLVVDMIAHVPWGAHPTPCAKYYDMDEEFLRAYVEASKKEDSFQRWLEEWVLSLPDHHAYLKKVGLSEAQRLRAEAHLGYAPTARREEK